MKNPNCSCEEKSLEKIEHPDNSVDFSSQYSQQGYQVYQCKSCKKYWGLRYQYDPGTGCDNHWKCFGEDFKEIYRHY